MFSLTAFSVRVSDEPCNSHAYLSSTSIEWEDDMEVAMTQYEMDSSSTNLYNLILQEYGLLYSSIKTKDKGLFERYESIALDHCEQLLEQQYLKAEVAAIKSSIIGLKIAHSPWKGMFLGPKASMLIREAMEINPESALVQHLYANQQYFTPKIWGGSPENAAFAYQKAIDLYQEEGMSDCWLYLDAHAWLGIVQEELGNEDQAKEVWKYIVEVSPEFAWVRDQLLPELEESRD